MNRKNWLFALLVFFIGVSFVTTSCKKSDDSSSDGIDEWFEDSDFTGKSRNGAIGFTIGSNGYLTAGYDGTNFRNDSWKFTPTTGAWEKLADFPGDARYDGVSFVIGDNAYVGTGIKGSKSYTKDFYKYDSKTNTWSKIADYPGDASYGAIAFSLNGKGYVGTGYSEENDWSKEFYEYDPATDKWSSMAAPFPGSKRVYGFTFTIDGVVYVGGGVSNNQFPKDFYKFDGAKWTRLQDLNRDDNSYTYDVTRKNASVFVINNMGYVTIGSKSSVIGSTWKYNPKTDVWNDDHQSFLGSARDGAVSFSLNNAGYITTGKNGSSRFDDTWKFTPLR